MKQKQYIKTQHNILLMLSNSALVIESLHMGNAPLKKEIKKGFIYLSGRQWFFKLLFEPIFIIKGFMKPFVYLVYSFPLLLVNAIIRDNLQLKVLKKHVCIF